MAFISINRKRLLLSFPLLFAMLVTSTFSVSARPIYYGAAIQSGAIVQSDVFLTGNNVVVDGTVVGDAFVLGNNVLINGTIEGSLVSVSQTILITGKVKGTTYIAAMAFDLGSTATLSRNLYYGGLSLATRKGSSVARDISAFSLGGTLLGQTNGNVKAVIGPYEILKLLFEAMKVNIQLPGMIYDNPELSEPNPEIHPTAQPTAQPTSAINNPGSLLQGFQLVVFQVTVPTATNQAPTATLQPIGQSVTQSVSKPNRAPQKAFDWQMIGGWFLGRLRSLIVLMAFCSLAFWSMPDVITHASGTVRKKPLPSLGVGLIGSLISFNAVLASILVAVVITAVGFWMVFATVWELGVFIWVAGLSLVLLLIVGICFFTFYVTKAIVAYTLARMILRLKVIKSSGLKFLALLLGIIVYVLLAGLPYAGWIIGLLATGFGFGSAWLDYREHHEQKKTLPTSPALPKTKPVTSKASRSTKI